jgi:hypothetical protein
MKRIIFCVAFLFLLLSLDAIYVTNLVYLKNGPDDNFAYVEVESDIKGLKVYGSNIRKIEKISDTKKLVYCFNGSTGLSFRAPNEKTIYKSLLVQNGKYYRLEVLPIEPKLSEIIVRTEPTDADVIIDDVYYGKSPVKIKIHDSIHQLIIRKEDYTELIDTIRTDTTKDFYVSLNSNFLYLKINTDPTAADVYLDNKFVGQTPFREKLEQRKTMVSLRLKNYYDYNTTVVPDPKKETILEIDLESRKVPINITCDHEADLFIDGIFVSTTPYQGEILRGKHKFELVRPKFKDNSFTVEVEEPFTKHVILKKKGFF